MNNFDIVFAGIIGIEGEYSNHPLDSGGATKFGITEALARRYGYAGDMRDLSLGTAKQIYRMEFWDPQHLGDMPIRLAEEVFEASVNVGKHRAGTWLQRSLNALNNRGMLYSDITEDGVIGPRTVAAIRAYLDVRPESVLLVAMNCLQGCYYISLTERRQKDEAFLRGWIEQRVSLTR